METECRTAAAGGRGLAATGIQHTFILQLAAQT